MRRNLCYEQFKIQQQLWYRDIKKGNTLYAVLKCKNCLKLFSVKFENYGNIKKYVISLDSTFSWHQKGCLLESTCHSFLGGICKLVQVSSGCSWFPSTPQKWHSGKWRTPNCSKHTGTLNKNNNYYLFYFLKIHFKTYSEFVIVKYLMVILTYICKLL